MSVKVFLVLQVFSYLWQAFKIFFLIFTPSGIKKYIGIYKCITSLFLFQSNLLLYHQGNIWSLKDLLDLHVQLSLILVID